MSQFNHVYLVTAEGPDGTEIDFEIEAVDQVECQRKAMAMLGHNVMITYIEDEGADDELDEDGEIVYPQDEEDDDEMAERVIEGEFTVVSSTAETTTPDESSFIPDIDVAEV